MTVFEDSERFYACMQRLFERVQHENPLAAELVENGRVIIQLECREPEAGIVINGRRSPAQISFGTNRVRPDVKVELTTDILHRILLGELRLPQALGQKKMRVTGPVVRALALADLFTECQAVYPQVLLDQGIII